MISAIGLVVYLLLAVFVTYSLCRTAAPETKELQELEDEDQLKYLRSLR